MASTTSGNYNIIQYSSQEQLDLNDLDNKSVPPKTNDETQDFQQWICQIKNANNNNINFQEGHVYLIEIQVPPDKNYNLNFGIRLMNISDPNTKDNLREKYNYQFIKYITIPMLNQYGTDVNDVWLYHIKNIVDNEDINIGKYNGADNQKVVNAAVAVNIVDYENDFNIDYIINNFDINQRKNKFFYSHNPAVSDSSVDVIWMCDNNGDIILENDNPLDFYATIEKNDIIMAQTFDSGGASNISPVVRRFIIAPEEDYNSIFFCLKLIPEDTDIQWQDSNNNIMYGRHVELNDIVTKYAELPKVWSDTSISNVQSIGVWGRSEQIMAINGQEVKIGPSGYFELKDFDIESLHIANTEKTDKYTVDVQYQIA